MSEHSKIEWTDHTFNPWEGCQKVGPGCDHCYAETRNARFGGGQVVNWGPGAPRRRTSPANWRKPLAWNRNAGVFYALHRRRQRVFCASLADVFDNAVSAQWRFDLLRLIVETPNLDWLLLTKRIGNAAEMLEQAMRALTVGREGWRDNYLPNVWIGATICNQEEADRDIPKLLAVPARVRFLSIEPLLGPVDLTAVSYVASPGYFGDALQWHHQPHCSRHKRYPAVNWVIAGGESGAGARPMHPDWARSLRDQCAAAGVPFLFKQWGEWLGAGQDGNHDHDPIELNASDAPVRVGKKAAGRLLDGVQHDGFPEITA
ncbi:phage Gp37/Gp68 family protein [Cupriavidus basilensis]|uniref:Phage Gp37/Gp68 family protein n=1 Tax=Cupriavidus basilensis TaxID=68895 RepID=A0A643FK48_9BURK|nr:phage Gp37/Gp68 family protein [Cupriavidus basilensis]QOT74856.1 phage Gp37/Gp68 family protein [Cupriavidus basilensis]